MLRFKNGFRRLASRLAWRFAAPVALCAGLLASAPASAASLAQVPSGWQVGTEPSWVSMYWYVPDNLPANAPVLVLVHYCSGNAQGIFGQAQSGGIVTQADQKKILLVVPQTSPELLGRGDRELPQARRRQQRHEGHRRHGQVRDRPTSRRTPTAST